MMEVSSDLRQNLRAAIEEAEQVSGKPGSVPLIAAVYYKRNRDE